MSTCHSQKTKHNDRRSVVYALGSTLCLTLAMFIWMKLRVVTGVPRTAYAEPEITTPKPTVPTGTTSPAGTTNPATTAAAPEPTGTTGLEQP